MSDWIPDREADAIELMKKWLDKLAVQQNQAAYGWDAAECTELSTAINAAISARSQYEADDSSGNRLLKDNAIAAAISGMRDFAKTKVKFSKKVPANVKLEMGVHTDDPVKTPVKAIDEVPELWIVLKNIREVHVHYKRIGHQGRGRPPNAGGISIRWAIADHFPTSLAELTNYTFDTDGVCVLGPFDEADRGKRLYCSGAWEIHRDGITGPPSEIVEAVIP